jgi:hypothetical protein
MAYMIPNKPQYFDTQSREDFVFEQLQKLSDDFYIFHSFKMLHVNQKNKRSISDGEIDFLIFHKEKGMLILEVKSGVPSIIEGSWHYQSGRKMPHGGPFNQAMRQKYLISELCEQKDKKQIVKNIKFMHAICLPSVSKGQLLNLNMPLDGHKELVITHSDFDHLEQKIFQIFDLDERKNVLNPHEVKYILNDILAPTYQLVGIKGFDVKLKDQRFLKLLNEQYAILEFLEHQKFATIQGVAGTGKTMIALEKARQWSNEGFIVLFIVYNRSLRDHLEQTYKHKGIEYSTIDYFAKKHEQNVSSRYFGLSAYLESCYLDEKVFPYDRVIIDEGQDLGIDEIESLDILKYLFMNIAKKSGYMYIFYDSLQLVQGQKIPEIIQNSDCKMTLYKNCRNTLNIAKTSLKPLDHEPKMFDGAIMGVETKLVEVNDSEETIKKVFELSQTYYEEGYKDIVVLSVKSKEKSLMKDYEEMKVINALNSQFKWTTSRKFKGLEAEVVILVDVDDKTYEEDKLVFYVGASRAKYVLVIVKT